MRVGSDGIHFAQVFSEDQARSLNPWFGHPCRPTDPTLGRDRLASIYPEASGLSSFSPQILEHSLWVLSSMCPLQIHSVYGINRKQPKVSHLLIINKTGPDQGHISTTMEKEREEGCPIPLFNINYVMCFHLNSEKELSVFPGFL